MPQSFTLYPDLTVRENVDFVASLFGMSVASRRRRTREVLELVDLWDVRGRRAGRLSGGMQRRLELAGALVHDPALLFLDEPTAGIDPLLRARVWDELHRLRDDGRTLLVTTQYLNEAESCDQVALIAGGRLIALATPDELRRDGGRRRRHRDRDRGAHSTAWPWPTCRSSGTSARTGRHLTLTSTTAGPRRRTPSTPSTSAAARSSRREIRATFDDVFATLVARDDATRASTTVRDASSSARRRLDATPAEASREPTATHRRGGGMRAPPRRCSGSSPSSARRSSRSSAGRARSSASSSGRS